jgi:thiamine transport system substrate-binding protein
VETKITNSEKNSALHWALPSAMVLAAIAALAFYLSSQPGQPSAADDRVRVLSYSSFISSWGPGPDVAKAFEAEFGVSVEFQDAGDAGLILKKLELFPADVVVGLDQLTLAQALESREWKSEFVPFDKGAMTFVYRANDLVPPSALEDLLDGRFKGAIALQDPRTSTPGLQFLFWVLDEMGVEEGFEFLAKLKTNVHSVSSSWSSAYGLFFKGQAKTAFSYVTSPVYHWVEDEAEQYQPAVFPSGHPVQIEYAGVPDTCSACDLGKKFADFLLRPEIQKVIMTKNYMMPVVAGVTKGTPFERLPEVREREWKSLPELLKRREEFFERWRQLGL